ncbi:uncharacterized protein LOC101846263 [Aplysia californica]|uniref:Uncharacterized protein LOC101846263 n=1 Tax=Aplysia californica TaxID=6500 RepID=A0ABM1AEA2_APLCA|nr:uncharacterized protein LOC101846263 [Aplysia californica]
METAGLLNALFKYIKGDPVERNKTEVEPETCSNLLIKETLFYQLCLIPSVVIVLILCCTQKRRNLVLHVLKGRPGLVYPMDLSGRSHRISYACAFGSTVYLIVACILDSFRAIEFDGPFFLKNLILIISVLIFGIVYLPVFLCLTLGSIYGFVLGAAYTWMLTAVQLIRMSQCDYDKRTRVVVVVRNLPELLCLLYLSCVLLVRAVQAFRSRQFGVGTIERRVQDEKMEDILESTPGKRVRILLTPSWRLEKKPEASSRLRKVLTLVQELTYRWEPDFKYSARLLSTLMVGLMVLYAVQLSPPSAWRLSWGCTGF